MLSKMQKASNQSANPLDLKTTLGLMREVSTASAKGSATEAYVFRDRLAIRDELKRRLEAQGSQQDDRYLDTAIAEWESAQNRFEEPSRNFRYKLAETYLARWAIARWVGIPIGAAGLIAILALGSIRVANEHSLNSKEHDVEAKVETLYTHDRVLTTKLSELQGTPLLGQLPADEALRFKSSIDTARNALAAAEPFFLDATQNGRATEKVTRANFTEVAARVTDIERRIGSAESSIGVASGIVSAQQLITDGRKTLDGLLAEIKSTNPPLVILTRAETLYQGGIIGVSQRQPEQVKSYTLQLTSLRDNTKAIIDLNTQSDRLYKAILAIAKEDKAVQQANSLQAESQQYLGTADVGNLRQTVDRLGSLEQILKVEFTVKITGGKERISNSNSSIRNYYLLVEAVDQSGKVIFLDIRNEETGKTEQVNHWGERAPKSLYDAVNNDYSDNQIIDKNKLGAKQKGLLSWDRAYNGNPYDGLPREGLGQITRW